MHAALDIDGMRVLAVSKFQDRVDKQKRPLPGRTFDPPLQIVHARDIASYYGLDIRDVWPAVHGNEMGQRVPYNTGTQKASNRTEHYWRPEQDAYGQTHMIEDVREVPQTVDIDDGIYARLSDVLYYAKAKGWAKGAGLPQGANQAATDVAGIASAVVQALVAAGVIKSAPVTPVLPIDPPDIAAIDLLDPLMAPKPKRTLSPEHQATLAAGREAAAKAKRANVVIG